MPWFYVGQDPAAQRVPTAQIAVLGIEVMGVAGAAITEASTRFADELTEALRRQAAAGPYKVITQRTNAAPLHLIDLKLMNNCPDERTACMQVIGRGLAADHLLYGHAALRSRGTPGHHVTLRLLDVASGRTVSWEGFFPATAEIASRASEAYNALLARRGVEQGPPADRVLVRATNAAFWQLTKHKPGQKLDMSDPRDRAMSKTWLDLYAQIKARRDRATTVAQQTVNAAVTPYVLVVERANNTVRPQTFERRTNLDVQYQWMLAQVDDYAYLAMFDFTQRRDAPVADEFSISLRPSATATSGWYASAW